MILYKKFKFSFFIILLMVALSSYLIFINHGLICNFKGGIEKDICFSNLMLNQDRIDILKHIENDLIRDVSYWTFISRWFKGRFHENYDCNLIENTYLRYMCIRLGFRPHMISFITTRVTYSENNDLDNLFDKCSYYDSNFRLFCIYTNAAILAKYNFSQAKHICSQLNDEMLTGECSFYIASSFAMNIVHKTSERIGLIMDFCEKIIHPDWRSECYYVLADELALTKPERLEDIAIACRKSSLAGEYGCFSHVQNNLPSEMPLKKLLEFCDLAESFIDKVECFNGFGETIGRRSYSNVDYDVISACNKVPIDFRVYCFKHLSVAIEQLFSEDINFIISSCNKIPLKFREHCFNSLGEKFGRDFYGDIDSAISSCNKIPLGFRENCFNGLCKSIESIHLRKDTNLKIWDFIKFPNKFEKICFDELDNN